MLLRELELDLFGADVSARQAFGLRTRCITSLYAKCLPKTSIGAWKVIVECVEDPGLKLPVCAGGVWEVRERFDVERFRSLTKLEGNRVLLQTLQRGILGLAATEGWSPQPFEVAAAEVVALNYKNAWQTVKRSPDHRWRAVLACCHDEESFVAELSIVGKDDRVRATTKVLETLPDEWFYRWELKTLRWLSDESVAVLDGDGRVTASLLVPAD